MLQKILLAILISVTMGCTKNDDDNNNNTTAAPPAAPAPPNNGGTGNNSGAPVPELVGTWVKPCTTGGANGHRRDSLAIDATTFQMMVSYDQADATCAGTPDLEARAVFNYSLPAAYTAGNVNNVDLVLNNVLARVNSTTGAAAANVASLCGFNDWQAGVERDVTGRHCIEDLPDRGRQYYQIFKLQGTNQLFVGNFDSTHNGESPAQRPAELETQPFTK
jgi:hypothetical protein